jgi:uncharacterized protein (TIGR03435 family)
MTRAYFSPTPGIRWLNAPLRTLIVRAYEIPVSAERFTLQGGPDSLLALRFDVSANEPEGTPSGQTMAMLRTLLAERFDLRIHREMRQMPIYALTLAREGALGPNLRRSSLDCTAFTAAGGKRGDATAPRSADGQELCVGDRITGAALTLQHAGPLAQLVTRAQRGSSGRHATGLTGSYDWRIAFSLRDQIDSTMPSIYTALREQLGLRLEPRTGPVEVLVIDSVKRPTPDWRMRPATLQRPLRTCPGCSGLP